MKRTNLKHRILRLLLALAMVIGLLPTGVSAAGYTEGNIPGTTGSGTASDPVMVNTYSELKQALEYEEDLYIQADSFENTPGLSFYALEPNTDYLSGSSAIAVVKVKHLTINTVIDCRAQSTEVPMYSFISICPRASLILDGDNGRLKASFNAPLYPSAVIFCNSWNGSLDIKGEVTVEALQFGASSHGYAVYFANGTMNIENGYFYGVSTKTGTNAAVLIYQPGDSLNATIRGGTFYCGKEDSKSLMLMGEPSEQASIQLLGGRFQEVLLPSGKSLSDYHDPSIYGTRTRDGFTEIYRLNEMTSAGITVTEPAVGETPSAPVTGNGSTIGSYTWYDGDGNALDETSVFEYGQQYRLQVIVYPVSGKQYAPNAEATINGKNAEIYWQQYSFINCYRTFTMPADPSKHPVSSVVITGIDEPILGTHPDFTMNIADAAAQGIQSSIKWIRFTDSSSPAETMNSSDVFEPGYYYSCCITLTAGKNSFFPYMETTDILGDTYNEYAGTLTVNGMSRPTSISGGNTVLDTVWWGRKALAEPSVPVNPFVDVTEDQYFYEPVLWALKKGITNGTDASHFSPSAPCTRGQVVTFLWRAAGSPKPSAAVNPFSDVTESDYFYKAVLWAVEKGITNGTDATHFSPASPCTRGQVVTFQYRARSCPAVTGSNPFQDVTASDYFADAVLWAVQNGITNGTSAASFSPNATCTRGQIVTFLYRDYTK